MNAIEVMQRADALGSRIKAAVTVEQAKPYIEELRRLHADQCLRCYCSSDDPKHQPRRGFFGRMRSSECAYLARLPADKASSVVNRHDRTTGSDA